MTDQEKWNRIYSQKKTPGPSNPLLQKYAFLFPEQATTLDLACGLGGNSLYLAQLGCEVTAWDISSVALEKLTAAANKLNLNIKTDCLDVRAASFEGKHFDLIIVNYYLDRNLAQALVRALNPSGILFYQTFVQKTADTNKQTGPKNPAYLLKQNELLKLFTDLSPRVFLDLQSTGDTGQGLRNESLLIAEKV
ncbi:MAG: class I SAM-dependent methyltransferase [Gammaproteobacteria bacterium]|nr:class I SAM-dependent methyltransferase [Gammaproteobacteria bacterium]